MAVPLLGVDTALMTNGSPSGSTSFARTSITLGVLAVAETASSTAWGGSGTGLTVMSTVAAAVCPPGAATWKSKLSLPLKLRTGEYVTSAEPGPVGLRILRVPLVGALVIVKVSGSPSGSEPVSMTGSGVSSSVITLCGSATGPWAPGSSVMAMVTSGSPAPFSGSSPVSGSRLSGSSAPVLPTPPMMMTMVTASPTGVPATISMLICSSPEKPGAPPM